MALNADLFEGGFGSKLHRVTALLVVGLVLSAEPSRALSVASTGLRLHNVDQSAGEYHEEHLAQQLTALGVRVVTRSELSAVIGLERQRQLLGCASESASCMAELGNALGVDGLIVGSLGRFGEVFQFDVKVVSATDGKLLANASSRVTGEAQLLGGTDAIARTLAAQLLRERGARAGVSGASAGGRPTLAFIPMGVGVVAVGVGTIFVLQANGAARELDDAAAGKTQLPPSEALRRRNEGQAAERNAAIAFGLGAALAIGGAAWFFTASDARAEVAVSASASGIALSGSF